MVRRKEAVATASEAASGQQARGKSRAFEVIRDRIRSDLISGTITPGEKLPPERELAERLGFSRAAVREALRGLEATGIVELQPGIKGGAFIRNGEDDGVRRSINDVIILGKIPLGQVMEVRSLLLTRAVQLVCEQANLDDLALIEKNINDTESYKDCDHNFLKKYVLEFYSLLGKLSGNQVLALLIDATASIVLDFAVKQNVGFPTELVSMRRNVLRRLRARDADGAVRAINENVAFLHGWVIARSTAR